MAAHEPDFDPDVDLLPAEADAYAGLLEFARSSRLTGPGALADDMDLAEIEVLMANHIPSSTFIMRAVPLQNGKFQALFAAPGLVPDIAKKADGTPYEYNTEAEAEHGAARTLFRILNGVRRNARSGKHDSYRKLTGPEFATLLSTANITPNLFAYLYGTRQQRVLKWIDGAEDIPHPVRILLELFIADPKNIDRAESVTDGVTTPIPSRREAS